MSVTDPRSSFTFANAPGSPALPDVSQAAILFGVGTALSNSLAPYSSGQAVRAAFGEARITEIADAHFALDPSRRPLGIVGTRAGVPGVLYLDTSQLVGTSVASADGVVTPLGDWPGIRVDVVQGGTIGTEGILLDLSIDYGQTKTRVALGTAAFVEFDGLGIKINFAAGTLTSGFIAGRTAPPKWTVPELQTAFDAARGTNAKFSLIGIAEPLDPTDGSTISTFLNAIEASTPRRFAHVIASVRRQYATTATVTIEATFANANPDTLTRAAGSFVTDGFKPGMRVTIANAVEVTNNGTFVSIATVTALTLTFTTNVAFTAEAATAGVTVIGQETDADYATNIVNEWVNFEDHRVTLTVGELRYTKGGAPPWSNSQIDSTLAGFLLSRAIAEPIHVEPGQRAATPLGGGRVAGALGGRVYQGLERVLNDVAQPEDAALVTAPARFSAVQSEADGRPGVFFVDTRTMFATDDQIKFMRMARLANEAKIVILTIQVNAILSPLPANPEDPNKLSARAVEALEKAGRNALRSRFKGMVSNVDSIAEPIFTVDPNSDLSTQIINTTIFLRTLFYPNGFATTLQIVAPGT